MIGIVLVTHGRLANEFLAALEHVVGPQEQAAVVSIGPQATLAEAGYESSVTDIDVTNSGHVAAVADGLVGQFGRVDILVNNAGIARSGVGAEVVTDELWLNVLDVNLNGVFWCCRAFGKHMTGAVPNAVTANMCTLVPDREVYDDAQILMRYADDTLGRMWCSLTAAGNEHGMGFRVYGTEGALVWRQERPQELILQHADGWAEAITPGYPDRLSPAGAHACRLRGGHPEGYILAFANLYRDFADTVMARNLGADADLSAHHFPTVQDGVETLRFFEAAVRSNAAGGAWVDLP